MALEIHGLDTTNEKSQRVAERQNSVRPRTRISKSQIAIDQEYHSIACRDVLPEYALLSSMAHLSVVTLDCPSIEHDMVLEETAGLASGQSPRQWPHIQDPELYHPPRPSASTHIIVYSTKNFLIKHPNHRRLSIGTSTSIISTLPPLVNCTYKQPPH